MASESSEELTVSVDLPAELVDWLDEEASAAEVDRGTMVAQLLASYQTVTQLNGEVEDDKAVLDTSSVAEAVEENLTANVERQVETLITEQVTEATNGVQRQLGSRIDSVEAEFDEKIQDVRQRVIQIKKETDSKAPKDHTHPELEKLSKLQGEVESLQTELSELKTEYEESVPEQKERTEEHAERLEEIQDRLQTVAWVVSDLREAQQSSSGLEAVERIKRAAARADIERANCENCGEGVTLSLLTDPHCPHCDATVTNVEPPSGWFGKPQLTVASQLESGEEQ